MKRADNILAELLNLHGISNSKQIFKVRIKKNFKAPNDFITKPKNNVVYARPQRHVFFLGNGITCRWLFLGCAVQQFASENGYFMTIKQQEG